MPMKKTQSKLYAKYGKTGDAAVKRHATDPTNYSTGRVPPGLTNAVARVIDCGFGVVEAGKQNAGEHYFFARASICEPESIVHNGVVTPVRGLQTSIIEMVCQTKTKAGDVTTHDEHVESILNTMRTIMGEDYTSDAGGIADLEELAEGIKEAQPYVRFSTSQGKVSKEYPDPRTWENWHGGKGLEDYTPPDVAGEKQDDTEEVNESKASSNGKAKTSAKVPAAKKVTTRIEESEESEDDADPNADYDEAEEAGKEVEDDESAEDVDIDDLAKKADKKDKDAIVRLQDLALEAGVSEERINKAKNWKAVAEMMHVLEAAEKGEGREDTEEEQDEVVEEEEETVAEPAAPVKGDNAWYKPLIVKGDKKVRSAKAIECDIAAVDAKAKTVTLKNLDDGKTVYKNVAWDKLESGE